jgi:GNAT superfamily N-acetyltransferase
MPLTFTVEPWAQVWPELAPFWEQHWREVAIDQDHIKLDINLGWYDEMAACGMLHVVVARDAGQVVGYLLAMVRYHPRYKTSLTGIVDIYWLHPSYRRGYNGSRLLKYAEASLRQRGCERLYSAVKLSLDVGKVYERLGWIATERLYTKLLKE